MPSERPANEPTGELFATTHWSAVLNAGRGDSTVARGALARLCQTYWRPVYAYVRRRGYQPADAEDLTQAFFARILERNDIATVSPDRGRFRSFLLASVNHFLSDEWDKARAKKRGRDRVISLDSSIAESLYEQGEADPLAPELLFDRRWAITVLEEVHGRLRQEYARAGKSALFEAVRFSLMGERGEASYAELGRRLRMSEGAVKVAVHRLRQRYRVLLRECIAESVSSPDEVEEELRYLMRALASA